MTTIKKRIVVNPAYMKTNGTRRTGLKQTIVKNKIPSNQLKRNLIEKIRQHRQREALKTIEQNKQPTNTEKSTTTFSDSLTYLDKLAKQKHTKRKKRLTIDHKRNLIPLVGGGDGVPYGNLKNGKKQTYRQYIRSHRPAAFTKIRIDDFPETSPKYNERKALLQKTKEEHNDKYKFLVDEQSDKIKALESKLASYEELLHTVPNNDNNEISKNLYDEPISRRVKRLRRTIKRELGKRKGYMGVLVKNAQTKKRIQHEANLLKDVPMSDIRTYLKKHSLFKIGSAAPDSILRKTYEDAVLAGDVHNKNKDVLVHNYMTDDANNTTIL